jgi:leucyl-tRNA synthetase
MFPVMPHLISECLNELSYNKNLSWPKIENQYLIKQFTQIVIQINGKKRSIIKVKNDISEKELIKEIKENENVNKYLKNKEILKSIFIQNKLINIIIK